MVTVVTTYFYKASFPIRSGQLYINHQPVIEPDVIHHSPWDLAERIVKPG